MVTGLREASDFEPEWAEPVGEVIRRWVARSGFLRLSDRERVWEVWNGLLGPDAAHTRMESLKGGVATFLVDSSALLSELNNFRKQQLLEALSEDARVPFVRDLRFRLDKRGGGTRPASG